MYISVLFYLLLSKLLHATPVDSQQQLKHVKFKALGGELRRCQLTNYKTMSSTYVQLLVTYPFEM